MALQKLPYEKENPELGQLALARVPYTNMLRVIYPNGEYIRLQWKGEYNDLVILGIPKEKAERVLDYVWNFYHAYVDLEGAVIHCPPVLKEQPGPKFRAPAIRGSRADKSSA